MCIYIIVRLIIETINLKLFIVNKYISKKFVNMRFNDFLAMSLLILRNFGYNVF